VERKSNFLSIIVVAFSYVAIFLADLVTDPLMYCAIASMAYLLTSAFASLSAIHNGSKLIQLYSMVNLLAGFISLIMVNDYMYYLFRDLFWHNKISIMNILLTVEMLIILESASVAIIMHNLRGTDGSKHRIGDSSMVNFK